MDVTKFNSYRELETYHEKLEKERFRLENKLMAEQKRLTRYYRRERETKFQELITNPKDIELFKTAKKGRRIKTSSLSEETRQLKLDLYSKMVPYKKYIMEEWSKNNEEVEFLEFLSKECEELRNHLGWYYVGSFDKTPSLIIEEFYKKKNGEILKLLRDTINANSERTYNIKGFERDVHFVGYGTHSNEVQTAGYRKMTFFAIVADDFDMKKIENKILCWPEEHAGVYEKKDFLLFDKEMGSVSEKKYFNTKERGITSRGLMYGKNFYEEVGDTLYEIAFQEYKQKLLNPEQNKTRRRALK